MSAGRDLPPLYGNLDQWALVQADSLNFLKQLPSESVAAIVTDPPYGIAMASWDGGVGQRQRSKPLGFQAFSQAWAEEAARVLKPGAHLVAFAAARTAHRLTAGIEDAGLEVRDSMLWLYSSGMPKSRRLPNGQATALRPAYEPAVLARKPLARIAPGRTGTVAHNLECFGTGALNIDAARIARMEADSGSEGYWPANVTLGHDLRCLNEQCHPDCPVPLIDQFHSRPLSRMFHVAKATAAEREAGCEHLATSTTPIFGANGSVKPRSNHHPTVKPIELMRWLVRLTVPIGGVVLDPFTGSGSTGCAAVLENRPFIGLEREADYVDIARARLAHWAAVARDAARKSA